MKERSTTDPLLMKYKTILFLFHGLPYDLVMCGLVSLISIITDVVFILNNCMQFNAYEVIESCYIHTSSHSLSVAYSNEQC